MNQTWRASLDREHSGLLSSTQALLGETERVRYGELLQVNRREQYLLSRGLIRIALSRQYGKPIAHWKFRERAAATPLLENPTLAPLNLSVSHCGDWVLVALSEQVVGVDIESIKPRKQLSAIARRVFTQNQCGALFKLDVKAALDEFYRLWTAKEALYKIDPNPKTRVRLVSSAPWPLDNYSVAHTKFEEQMASIVAKAPIDQFKHFEMLSEHDIRQGSFF